MSGRQRHAKVRGGLPWIAIALLLVVIASGLTVSPFGAQETGKRENEGEESTRILAHFEGAEEEDGSPTFPKIWCGLVDDAETKAACWKAYRAGLDYYETGLRHRTRVIAWQHLSTRVIFFVVLLLVLTGVYFAWVQFRRGGPTQAHELEISMKGLKISSPVLGLIILVISLAFFYLYLVHVYPIQEII